LDPIVTFIERRLPRPAAVTIVVAGVILAFAGVILAIIPLLVEQISNLIKNGPQMVEDFMASAWYKDVSGMFGSTITDAVQGVLDFVQDPDNFLDIGGGVFAVGAGIAGGVTG